MQSCKAELCVWCCQALIYLLCKTYNYLCTCSTFKFWSRSHRGLLCFMGYNSCSLSRGDSVCLCVYVCVSSLPCTAMIKKKTKQKSFFSPYSCCLYISVFITWVLSWVIEREGIFSKECFHIPAIWDGSCHLSPLTTMFGTQSPSQNLVWWQILSPPFITWSWKISSVLLVWFDLRSPLRAKISQDEWKLEGIF